MLLTNQIKGVVPIAPTPFTQDGKVDASSIDRLIDYFEAVGADGITVLGQLGEAPKLDHEESLGIVRQFLARTRLPIIVGVSAPGFAAMLLIVAEK